MKPSSIILYLIIYILFSSCENEISYTPKHHEPQLIMNALLDAGEAENFVYLSLSGIANIGHVKQATVSLYINGKQAETPEELPPLKPLGSLDQDPNNPLNFLPEIAKRKKYRIRTALHPGDKVRLEADAENGKYHVSAEASIPYPVNAIQADTSTVDVKDYGWWQTYRQFKVNLQDRPGEKNHYRLDIRHEITAHGIMFGGKDTTITTREYDVINREDIVLTDGNPQNGEDEDDLFYTYIENKYNVFTDSRFANASHTLKVYTKLYDNFSSIYIEKLLSLQRTVTIRLLSITEMEYRYFKALNTLESGNYDEVLMEPVVMPNNIKGGLGFVGVSSEVRITMQLPDIIYAQDESTILH